VSGKTTSIVIVKVICMFCVTLFFIHGCIGDNKEVSITDLWMSRNDAMMIIGDTLSMNVVFYPKNAINKNVSWYSSDSEIVSVQDGLLTAEAIGTVSITVVSRHDGDKFATCSVTVIEPPIRIEGVTLSHAKETLTIGDKLTLKATIQPTAATNSAVDWKSSNPSVALIDDGVVTAVSVGEAVITVTTRDRGRTATCAIIVKPLKIVDPNATKETKALLRNLLAIQKKGVMFGHHDNLMYGREWSNVAGRSDVHEVVGDYPAVYSVDFAVVMDGRTITQNGVTAAMLKRTIPEAYARGEVIMACIHINDPLTGGTSWAHENKSDAVKEILREGSPTNVKYKTWLDRLANFANNLKAPSGELIPVLFRPYHEHTQTWSWWGNFHTTQSEFIGLWRFTVEYLRDTKSVHSFLYAISPQRDTNYSDIRDRLLHRWPGDEYIDFLGMDSYHGTNTSSYYSHLSVMLDISKEKGIPCGVTETGTEGIGLGADCSGTPNTRYWTQQQLFPLKTLWNNKGGETVSMVVVWRNKFVGNSRLNTDCHFYGPWINHPSADNFVEFYNDPITLFRVALPNMYQ